MPLLTLITFILVRIGNEMPGNFYNREEFEFGMGVLSEADVILLSKRQAYYQKRTLYYQKEKYIIKTIFPAALIPGGVSCQYCGKCGTAFYHPQPKALR